RYLKRSSRRRGAERVRPSAPRCRTFFDRLHPWRTYGSIAARSILRGTASAVPHSAALLRGCLHLFDQRRDFRLLLRREQTIDLHVQVAALLNRFRSELLALLDHREIARIVRQRRERGLHVRALLLAQALALRLR